MTETNAVLNAELEAAYRRQEAKAHIVQAAGKFGCLAGLGSLRGPWGKRIRAAINQAQGWEQKSSIVEVVFAGWCDG